MELPSDSTIEDAQVLRELPAHAAPPQLPAPRPSWGWMLARPWRLLALGLGSGLSPAAPGTAGTLWGWAAYLLINPWLDDIGWAIALGVGLLIGWWACTATARDLHRPDPGAVVWDEVIAFWLILWIVMPQGWLVQSVAFALFRYFDAVKPGPVGWADALFKSTDGRIGWVQGWGILFDDIVAAGCTLLVMAVGACLLRLL